LLGASEIGSRLDMARFVPQLDDRLGQVVLIDLLSPAGCFSKA
jgi:hypothetical protein